jgi:hypothetical protein
VCFLAVQTFGANKDYGFALLSGAVAMSAASKVSTIKALLPCKQVCMNQTFCMKARDGNRARARGLLCSSSPMCTLSQNGYGGKFSVPHILTDGVGCVQGLGSLFACLLLALSLACLGDVALSLFGGKPGLSSQINLACILVENAARSECAACGRFLRMGVQTSRAHLSNPTCAALL